MKLRERFNDKTSISLKLHISQINYNYQVKNMKSEIALKVGKRAPYICQKKSWKSWE